MLKALPIKVYRDSSNYDCTNGGISSRYDELLLICDRGFILIDEHNIPENAVKVVTKMYWGDEYKFLEPLKAVNSGYVGYIFGGNVACSSDSRFTEFSQYPLRIHDRQESQEQYNFCSD